MTDKEQYNKVFDKVASFGMEPLEVYRLMQKKRKHTYIHKAADAAAAAALIVCSTGVAYAANVGGIQRTIQLWVHGDQTNAELVIEDGHYSYSVSYQEDGSAPVSYTHLDVYKRQEYYGLRRTVAVAPGYQADLLVLDDLERVLVRDVYQNGRKVVSEGRLLPFPEPEGKQELTQTVLHSFRLRELEPEDFLVKERGVCSCRVIGILQDQLLTEERVPKIDFDRRTGIDTGRDLIKTAVIERHRNTGHTGLGFMEGTGIQYGAIASSVSHDSHNLIVMGADEKDMAFAANRIRSLGGGMAVVRAGKVEAEMPLPYAGLMTDRTAAEAEMCIRERTRRF